MRTTSGFWVGSYLRRAMGAGCFTSVVKRGAEEAGAIFVILNYCNGKFSLFGPAPQALLDAEAAFDRSFTCLLERVSEDEVLKKLEREKDFDPDLWIIENEDRQGRPFLELIAE